MALTDNLVSYWKLDETSGTTVTDALSAHNWTASRTNILNNTGKISNWWVFVKASSDRITFGDVYKLTAYTDMSFSFWYKSSASWTDDDIISNYWQTVWGWWTIDQRADNKIHFTTWNGSWSNSWEALSNTTVNDGNWHHIVCIKTWTSWIVYLDGIAGTSGTIASIAPTDGMFAIGWESRVYWYNDCSVDEVGVWSRALSAWEVTSLYNGWAWLAYPFGFITANASILLFYINQ